MTKLLPYSTFQNTGGDIAQSAGGAPLGSQMQGNPSDSASRQNTGNYPPGPQTGGATQTVNTPSLPAMMSQGAVPANVQPSNNAATLNGTDTLMAQISRGQLSLGQTNYGQGGFMPANAGSSPQAPQSGTVATNTVAAGIGSTVAVGANPNYVGD